MMAPPIDLGIIAIVRLRNSPAADEVLEALTGAGINNVEVTLGTPGCLETVARWSRAGRGDVGIGSVRTESDARTAIEAGARFLVTPTTVPSVLKAAAESGTPVICGAMTPTEIDSAWQQGATAVKVFPIDALGGAAYVRALQGPLPDIPLVPTGGVDAEQTREYSRLGCAGVGVGGALVGEKIAMTGDWTSLAKRAAAFVKSWQPSGQAGTGE
ncbi:bifunctional 4-hydroxy-2-oxoglutarate aldolase/2-dehydro-3-deoxy-phosphogluconate aldolase [Pseudarthrobacter sp. NamE2]|uniref:bifunctional 4-hydroxy-2-oxoglutarate aldolase/2-dehydro-3-deoxy-phosphogluconate aldolase n=1 Tax=Pseudarthrobacter sp. NamE2 TaxID=2576838 RepID=UPI0010FE4414|nr:bifunctional 4-hydroxy-2-oxoglutarate aldolase/2-dehydro-3-deoxy-phosphogluconate aldolase [Pseudarthrobacter sp. NamE2]TLM81977.1 bifunctional 4-hydroxy-2-oxoglutarate aldolase/2-dehydro-3-deoxy-phosphogluconate aldolase [Pseudarthrobacter sp. NamE2]